MKPTLPTMVGLIASCLLLVACPKPLRETSLEDDDLCTETNEVLCLINDSSDDENDDDGDPTITDPPAEDEIFEADVIVHPTGTNVGTITDGNGNSLISNPTSYPHVLAMKNAGKMVSGTLWGKKILLKSGLYDPFQISPSGGSSTATNLSGIAGDPVVVHGETGATIRRKSGVGQGILVIGNNPSNYVRFENLLIEVGEGGLGTGLLVGASGDYAAGVEYRGLEFINCTFDGGYNHAAASGANSKWGMLTWRVADFKVVGSRFQNIKQEHGIYMHNNAGPIEISHSIFQQLGRTGIQITARENDSGASGLPENPHSILIAQNAFADTGLAAPGYHEGQTITIEDAQMGTTYILRNLIAYGYDIPLKEAIRSMPDYPTSTAYGSGSVVVWSPNGRTNGRVEFKNNTILYWPDSGGRPNVSLNSANELVAKGNLIRSGTQQDSNGAFPNATSLVVGEGGGSHTLPLAYCIANNDLNRNFILDGGEASQPQSFGTTCP